VFVNFILLFFISGCSSITLLILKTGPVAGLSFCLITIRVGLSRIQDRDITGHLRERSSTDGHSLPTRVSRPPDAIIINVTREENKLDDYLEVGLDKYRENQSLSVTD
jgi:hypothetical protein